MFLCFSPLGSGFAFVFLQKKKRIIYFVLAHCSDVTECAHGAASDCDRTPVDESEDCWTTWLTLDRVGERGVDRVQFHIPSISPSSTARSISSAGTAAPGENPRHRTPTCRCGDCARGELRASSARKRSTTAAISQHVRRGLNLLPPPASWRRWRTPCEEVKQLWLLVSHEWQRRPSPAPQPPLPYISIGGRCYN